MLQSPCDDYKTLLQSSTELFQELAELVEMDEFEAENREHINSTHGVAIGTTWAAMCINDLLRTKKFIDGIYLAVEDCKSKKSNQPLEILYAGTGPFATLILPLISVYSSNELQFTLLEINKTSYTFLLKLIERLEIKKHIRDCLLVDATNYSIPSNYRPDIFICETMQQALKKEPQVSIYANILPQLHENCLIIPSKIALEAAFVDDKQRFADKMEINLPHNDRWKYKKTVFELSRNSVLDYTKNNKWPFEEVQFEQEKMGNSLSLYILTTIEIYNNTVLLPDECALTLPLKLRDFSENDKSVVIGFEYITGANPGLETTEI